MGRQLATVSALTALAQLLAFAKLWFTARLFGIGLELDAYNLALVLPTLMASVLAGALQTGLFPVRASIARSAPAQVPAFERTILYLCAGAGLLLCALLLAVGPELLAVFSKASEASAFVARDPMLRALALVLLLNLVGDCSSYLLAMRGRFALAAAAPIANAALGTVVLAGWSEGGLAALVLGTLVGSAVQVIICVAGLRSAGARLLGPVLAWRDARHHGQELLSLGGWILPGVVFSNLVVALPPLWIAAYGEGAVSAYGYAYRLHTSLLQFVFMASSTLILARFSEMVADDRHGQIASLLRKATAVSAAIGVGSVLVISVAGAWTLELLFSGRFDARAATAVSQHWLFLTIGLPFAILGSIFAKLWQAQRRPRLISAMAGCSLLTLLAVAEFGASVWGQYAVPLAQSAAAGAVVLAGAWFLAHPRPRVPDGIRR